MKRYNPVMRIFFTFILFTGLIALTISPAHSGGKKKNLDCDSLVYPSHWQALDLAERKIPLTFQDGIQWVGTPGNGKETGDSSAFGFDCAVNETWQICGKLGCRLRKDHIYNVCCEIKVERIDSAIKCIGFSIRPGSENEISSIPRFLLSRYEMDSMTPGKWKTVVFPLIATGEEKEISIYRKYNIEKKTKQLPNYMLVRNLHLEHVSSALIYDDKNLLVNGDMELYGFCPIGLFSGDLSFYYWQKESRMKNACVISRDSIYAPSDVINLGSPDFYSLSEGAKNKMPLPYSGRCFAMLSLNPFGFEKPRRGWGYGGEFLEQEIKQPLEKNVKYKVTFAYMKAPGSPYGTNSLGIKFTACPFSAVSLAPQFISVMPDGDYFVSDSVSTNGYWQIAQIEFTANGTEKYFTVGAFRENGVKEKIGKAPVTGEPGFGGYYFVDDFRLEKEEN